MEGAVEFLEHIALEICAAGSGSQQTPVKVAELSTRRGSGPRAGSELGWASLERR